MPIPLLTEMLMQKLENIGRQVAPREAVGLILPDNTIIKLPNRSLNAENSFTLTAGDIRIALELHGTELSQSDWASTTLWHTHPSGGVGPSRIDMQNRLPGVNHLVVALLDKQAIPSWY